MNSNLQLAGTQPPVGTAPLGAQDPVGDQDPLKADLGEMVYIANVAAQLGYDGDVVGNADPVKLIIVNKTEEEDVEDSLEVKAAKRIDEAVKELKEHLNKSLELFRDLGVFLRVTWGFEGHKGEKKRILQQTRYLRDDLHDLTQELRELEINLEKINNASPTGLVRAPEEAEQETN